MARQIFFATFLDLIRISVVSDKQFHFLGRLNNEMVNHQELLDLSRVDSMPGEQDFVIFMQQNQESVYRLALYLLGNTEEAKDAAQESFVKAWKKFETFRSETGRAWIMKITVNLCLDWLRRRKFRNDFPESESEIQEDFEYRLPDPNPDPLEQCLSDEMQAKVTEAISKLPVTYRSVVILRDLEGLGYQEIADVLNTKISKVKSSLFRGRRKLKEILRPFFEVSV
jgi:RNA polymerase sigma-70 factor (ECF subfamily)